MFKRRHFDWLFGFILLVAASLKFEQLYGNTPGATPGILFTPVLAAWLIQSELLLALWLLIGGFARLRFIVAVGCFSIFALVSGYEAMHAMASCGCFGNVKVPPTITAAFDVSAVVALCWTRRRPSPRPSVAAATEGERGESAGEEGWPSRWRLIAGITAAIVLSGGLWCIYFVKAAQAGATGASTLELRVLEPETWIDKPFPLFDEIGASDPLKSGKWLVVLYHYDCEDCLKAIPVYQALAASQSPVRVAFIAMPPFATAGQEPVAESTDYLHLRLRPDYDWFATTPVVIQLGDGRVLAAAEGAGALEPAKIR
jgi:hypothetical protein